MNWPSKSKKRSRAEPSSPPIPTRARRTFKLAGISTASEPVPKPSEPSTTLDLDSDSDDSINWDEALQTDSTHQSLALTSSYYQKFLTTKPELFYPVGRSCCPLFLCYDETKNFIELLDKDLLSELHSSENSPLSLFTFPLLYDSGSSSNAIKYLKNLPSHFQILVPRTSLPDDLSSIINSNNGKTTGYKKGTLPTEIHTFKHKDRYDLTLSNNSEILTIVKNNLREIVAKILRSQYKEILLSEIWKISEREAMWLECVGGLKRVEVSGGRFVYRLKSSFIP